MLMILYRERLFDSMLWRLKICELVHLTLPIVSRSITVINWWTNTIESSARLTFWAIQASRWDPWQYMPSLANMTFDIAVGLFNNISSGVAELFYEPWQGIMISDRPHELGVGIARVTNILNRWHWVWFAYMNDDRVLAVLYLAQYLDLPTASASSQEVLERAYLPLHWIVDISNGDWWIWIWHVIDHEMHSAVLWTAPMLLPIASSVVSRVWWYVRAWYTHVDLILITCHRWNLLKALLNKVWVDSLLVLAKVLSGKQALYGG